MGAAWQAKAGQADGWSAGIDRAGRQCLAALDDHAGAALVAGLLAMREEQVVKG